jgi:hypothetical protein
MTSLVSFRGPKVNVRRVEIVIHDGYSDFFREKLILNESWLRGERKFKRDQSSSMMVIVTSSEKS